MTLVMAEHASGITIPPPRDSLRPWLREWARWHMGSSRTGYGDSTPLHRVAQSPTSLPPASRIPDGAEPPRYMEPLCLAMNQMLNDPRTARPIAVVRAFYCARGSAAEATAEAFRLPRSKVYELREQGEMMLRAYLKAMQEA